MFLVDFHLLKSIFEISLNYLLNESFNKRYFYFLKLFFQCFWRKNYQIYYTTNQSSSVNGIFLMVLFEELQHTQKALLRRINFNLKLLINLFFSAENGQFNFQNIMKIIS